MITLHALESQPDPPLAEALAQFERQFWYPLGASGRFRISHGEDYTRFFRAIGQPRCWVAEQGGAIVAVLSVTRCPLRLPSGQQIEAAYFSDLKVASPSAGRTVLRLLKEGTNWARQTPTNAAFSIVMAGTPRDPSAYTGRLGIPAFLPLSRILLLRLDCRQLAAATPWPTAALADVRTCFTKLTAGCCASLGGDPSQRSQLVPQGGIIAEGRACGIIEDTRRSKRLFREEGEEIVSAHLGCFAFRDAPAAVTLLRSAAALCRAQQIDGLFIALPSTNTRALLAELPPGSFTPALATVFGTGLPAETAWAVNPSEI